MRGARGFLEGSFMFPLMGFMPVNRDRRVGSGWMRSGAGSVLWIILPSASATTSASVWHADKDNTGVEDGTIWMTAFKTIQPAIDAAYAAGGLLFYSQKDY
jgi:hypothetical protein